MTPEDLRATLDLDDPPEGLSTPLKAMWRAAKGEWDAAHGLAQSDESTEAAWVHAHLHRVEGDLSNAGYWYRRAGKPEAESDLEVEWADIVTALG